MPMRSASCSPWANWLKRSSARSSYCNTRLAIAIGTAQPQASPFMQPNVLLQPLHAVGSRPTKSDSVRPQRQSTPLFFNFLDAAEIDSLKHSDDQYS